MIQYIRWIIIAIVLFVVSDFIWNCIIAPFVVPEFWRKIKDKLVDLGIEKNALNGEEAAKHDAKKIVEEITKSYLSSIKNRFRIIVVNDKMSPNGKKWKYQMRIGFAWNTFGESWNENYFNENIRKDIDDILTDGIKKALN